MAKNKKGCFYGLWNSFLIIICLGLIGFAFFNFVNDDIFYKNRYPLTYSDTVNEYCDLYDVDKYLVHSIIRTESFYDDKAVSNKGAIGLMQIMPETGEWAAKKLDLKDFKSEDLYDYKKNIMIGVWYISYLSNKFDGNLDTMIAAYNAGPTNVSKWLLEKDLSEDGENLKDIPFDETKKYHKKVRYSYDMYKKIYNS